MCIWISILVYQNIYFCHFLCSMYFLYPFLVLVCSTISVHFFKKNPFISVMFFVLYTSVKKGYFCNFLWNKYLLYPTMVLKCEFSILTSRVTDILTESIWKLEYAAAHGNRSATRHDKRITFYAVSLTFDAWPCKFNSGHYHYQCFLQIWKPRVQCISSYRVHTIYPKSNPNRNA